MKKVLFLLTFSFILNHFSSAQEFATFSITSLHRGTGIFTSAVLPNFTWEASGELAQEVQILNSEVFDNGNLFEATFGQADDEDNLRIQADSNGSGTAGQPISSKVNLTIEFDQVTPDKNWGFCLVDIDVENCLISAIDENDNEVSAQVINGWLMELFDANLAVDSINIPKWDSVNAVLLGSDTPPSYTTYDSLVIGGLNDSEAAAAFFMPDIALKSLSIDYENLQRTSLTSYHFYIASFFPTSIDENIEASISIFPNPASDFLNIQLPKSKVHRNTPILITFYSVLGEVLSTNEYVEENITIDVSSFNKGVYYLNVLVGEKSFVRKLTIE